LNPIAKFIVPDWGVKVDSGIGLLYRHARLHRQEGRYDNLCRSQLNPPFRDYEFGHRPIATLALAVRRQNNMH
jgi:hypothetical protein